MVVVRLRYIKAFKDRHGVQRYYLRRRGFKAVALPNPSSPAFLDAYKAALAATEPVLPTSRVIPGSFEALTRSYLASPHFTNTLGSSTQAVYRRIINTLVKRVGASAVATLQPGQVRKMIADRSTTPAAANHILRTMRALMAHAVEHDYRPDDPTIGVKRLKEVGEGATTWSEEDIATFEAHWPIGSRPRLALALLIYTGQRRSDVVRMGHQHVRGNTILVRQAKTKTQLVLPLHPELASMLAEQTGRLTFLVTDLGAAFTANGFYMRFTKWAREAGLPAGRSPHGLRKATARRLAEAGCTAHQIQAVTGHKRLADLQTYTKAADQARLAKDAVVHLTRPSLKPKADGC